MLAYLALAERPVARTRLAGLIFGDADDPRGALRWTLAQLRRALGVADALGGDPLELGCRRVPRWTCWRWPPATRIPRSSAASCWRGVDPGAGPDFDAWLRVERRRFAGVCEAVLRDAALGELAAGAPLQRRRAGVPRARAQPVRRRRPRAARALPREGGRDRRRARSRRRLRGAVPPRARTRARSRRAPRGRRRERAARRRPRGCRRAARRRTQGGRRRRRRRRDRLPAARLRGGARRRRPGAAGAGAGGARRGARALRPRRRRGGRGGPARGARAG